MKSISEKGKKAFLFNKLDTIFYPYVLWSILQGGIEVILSKYTNSKTELIDVLSFLIYPRAQFWFLYALLMIFIFSTLIYKKDVFSKSLHIIIIISFIAYIFTNIIGTSFHVSYITNYIVFFFIGCLYSKLGITNRFNFSWLSLLITFLIFCVGEYIFHIKLKLIYTDVGVLTFSLAIIGIALITMLSIQLEKIKIKPLQNIGLSSMVIYLLHILSGSGSRIILSKIFNIQNWYIHIATGTILGIMIPVVVYFTTKKYHVNFLFSYPRKKNNLIEQ